MRRLMLTVFLFMAGSGMLLAGVLSSSASAATVAPARYCLKYSTVKPVAPVPTMTVKPTATPTMKATTTPTMAPTTDAAHNDAPPTTAAAYHSTAHHNGAHGSGSGCPWRHEAGNRVSGVPLLRAVRSDARRYAHHAGNARWPGRHGGRRQPGRRR